MSISDHILVCYSNPIDKDIIKAEALITELSASSRHMAIRTVAHLVGLLRPKL